MYLHLLSVNVKISKRLFADLISNLSADQAEIKIVLCCHTSRKGKKHFSHFLTKKTK